MRQTGRTHIPEDHLYFRSSFSGYGKYLETQKLTLLPLGKSFGWAKPVLGKFWGVVKFDRVDGVPNIESIKKESGLKHGLLIWIPWRFLPSKDFLRNNGWRRLYPATHFQHTGFGYIEEPYWKNWNERAQRARKKFFQAQVIHGLEIKTVSHDIWKKAFLEAKIRIPLRGDFARFYSDIYGCAGQEIENYLCYDGDRVLGGLSVIFYDTHSSVHLLSFLPDAGKKLQVGTGLIDYWYKRAQEKGLSFISLDHLRDMKTAVSQQGYTDFKMNFINVEIDLKESYFKMF